MKPKVYKQKNPVKVEAIQFFEETFADFEPLVHRSPGEGARRDDQGGFVFHGTDNKIWPVNDSDFICFVEERVFPSYVALNRNHSFVMSASEFKKHFGGKKDE